MSALTNKPMLEATSKGAISPALRKTAVTPVFKPDFARSLRMRPLLAGAVAAMVLVGLLAYALLLKPSYEAESLVYLEPGAVKVLDDGSGGMFDSTRYDSYVQQQVQTASRLDILTAAVRSLPVGVWRGAGEPEESAAARLQHSLKIERVLNSYQLSFTLQGPSAEHTAQTLNAVVAAYLEAGRRDELTTADQRAEILNEEKTRVQTELASARAEQSSLSSSLGMANPGMDSSNPYDAELSGLRAELASAREAHDIAAAQLASVSGGGLQGSQGLTAAADELIAGDAGLSSMKAATSQKRAELSGQMAGLTTENPIYKQDAVELSDLDRSLEQMTTQVRDKAERRLQDKLRTDLSRTGDVEARLNAQLGQETGAATSASPKLQRASELTADISRLMKRYATVDDALRGLELETSGPGTAHLALAATAPAGPMPSRRKLLLLAALPLALACGAFAAVFARKRDPRLYTGRDLEDLLGFTPIAVLPAGGEVPGGVMAEYILRLAGGIEGAYRVSGARTFVLTPVSGGGEVESLVGPLTLQLGKLGLGVTAVKAREVMTPAVMPAGTEGRRREGVVAAHLEGMLRRYDLLFIEAPALLTSAETEYLVRSADATILVAQAGVTRRGELLQAALLLERLQVHGVAAVLEGLQLRYADASFRRAIADLERREAAETKTWTRERVVAEPVASAARHERYEPALRVPAQAARVEEPEPVVHAVDVPAVEVVDKAAMDEEPLVADALTKEAVADAPAQVLAASEDLAQRKDEHGSTLAEPVATEALVRGTETMDDLRLWDAREETRATSALEVAQPVKTAPAEEPEAVSGRSRPMHRSVPVRRVTESQEREGNWFKRLFVRDAEPMVSIIPDNEDEEEEAAHEAPGERALPGFAARLPEAPDLPLVTAEEQLDADHYETVAKAALSEGPAWAAPAEPMIAAQEGAPITEVVEHPLVETKAQEMPVAVNDFPVAVAIDTGHETPIAAEPVREPVQRESVVTTHAGAQPARAEEAPEPAVLEQTPVAVVAPLYAVEQRRAEVVFEPVAAMPAAREPEAEGQQPDVALPEHAVATDADFESVWETVAATPEPGAPPASPVLTVREPLRAARWAAADLPSRADVTPWRDRRVSGPNTAYKAPERRFNWNTFDATPSGSNWPVAQERPAAETRLPITAQAATPERTPERVAERPRLVQSDERPDGTGRLTRQWGLLSRFSGPDAPGREREVSEFGDDVAGRSQRGRRRG